MQESDSSLSHGKASSRQDTGGVQGTGVQGTGGIQGTGEQGQVSRAQVSRATEQIGQWYGLNLEC